MIIDARLRQPLAWLASLVFVAGCAQDAPEQQPVSDDPLVRTTVEGTVRGQVGNNGALEWLGIPFAEPPTDELRWMPPLPPRKGWLLVIGVMYFSPEDAVSSRPQ